MASRTDTAEHAGKAFDYPVMGHWGKAEVLSSASGTRTDKAAAHSTLYTATTHFILLMKA